MWVKNNQEKLRIELYNGLKDAIMRGDTTPASTGKRLILPSSFTGSPRYMIENYEDAMAICRWAGYPDLSLPSHAMQIGQKLSFSYLGNLGRKLKINLMLLQEYSR